MEELAGVAMDMVLVSLGLIAGPVAQPTQVRTRSVPTATTVSSEVIAGVRCQPVLGNYGTFPILTGIGWPNSIANPSHF